MMSALSSINCSSDIRTATSVIFFRSSAFFCRLSKISTVEEKGNQAYAALRGVRSSRLGVPLDSQGPSCPHMQKIKIPKARFPVEGSLKAIKRQTHLNHGTYIKSPPISLSSSYPTSQFVLKKQMKTETCTAFDTSVSKNKQVQSAKQEYPSFPLLTLWSSAQRTTNNFLCVVQTLSL